MLEKKSTLSFSQSPALQTPEPLCLRAAAPAAPRCPRREPSPAAGVVPSPGHTSVTPALKAAGQGELCAAVGRGHQAQANRVTP